MVNSQGFDVLPLKHAAPVTFHPENVQLGAETAVRLIARPIGSEHPEEHEGLTIPFPTVAVVRVAHAAGEQLIVTVSTGASLIRLPDVPAIVMEYCLPGVAPNALTTKVARNVGYPHDCGANEVDNSPS
jgi:hypothetical protein